ncbi:hypothetical protein, partial [Nocardia sp. CC227C]|uniref:hypothetical protein n=1 Tax=Nocardia sp. CC227C TaxID=3044562 RepID=UPI00278C35C8
MMLLGETHGQDNRDIEARPDVLVYTGERLDRDLDVIGGGQRHHHTPRPNVPRAVTSLPTAVRPDYIGASRSRARSRTLVRRCGGDELTRGG